MVCLGDSKASELKLMVKGRGAGEVRKAIREQPQWRIWVYFVSGKCLWEASLESLDTLIFSETSPWENRSAKRCWYLANARHPLIFQGRT